MKKPDRFRHRGKSYDVTERLTIGRRRYLILRRLSPGRFARFQAIDPKASPDGEMRALHCLPNSQGTRNELRVLSRHSQSNHNVPTILEWHISAGEIYAVTKWIYGESLRNRMKHDSRANTKIGTEHVVRLFRGLVHGLSNLHYSRAAGHGDIKPDNIILTANESQFVLVDFGNGWTNERKARAGNCESISPTYTAPEVHRGELPSFLSDQFSATVVFYELLTGRVPFPPDLSIASHVREGIVPNRPAPPSRLNQQSRVLPKRVWKRIDGIVARGSAWSPADRFQTKREWLNSLDSLNCEIRRTQEVSETQLRIMQLFCRLGDIIRLPSVR